MDTETKAAFEDGFNSLKTQLDAKLAEHTAEIEKNGKASTDLTGQVDDLSGRLKEMRDEIADVAQRQQGHKGTGAAAVGTFGEQFISSDAFEQIKSGQREKVRHEVKNTVLGETGTTTYPMQRPGVVPGDFAPLTIRDLLPTIQVNTDSVRSMRELDWTNNAAEVEQGTKKPESDITFEQYNVPIETVAHWIKVSNQLLADAPAIASYIDTRLRDGLNQRIDEQLLVGNGTAPNLSGLTNAGNFTAYTPNEGDNLAEAINKAKYQLWSTGNMPDTVIVNPADWSVLELLKTTDGAYLYGPPGTMANTSPFGVNVVMSNHMPEGSFMVGSVRGSATLFQRESATVEMGFVNEDFINNLATIRCEQRLGLGVDRPSGLLFGEFTAAGDP